MAEALPDVPSVSPVLEGRHTVVRPVLPSDYDWLYRVAMLTSAGSRWRLHGEVPNFEQFLQFLFQGSKALCVIEDRDHHPLGMVQLWHHDPISSHAQLTVFLSPEAEGKGWPLEGVLLFVDYSFRAFNLRKVYIETLETELRSYRSLVGTVLREEGRFPDHKFLFGQWVTGYMFAIYPVDFEPFFARVVGTAAGRRPSVAQEASADAPVAAS